MHWNRVLEFNEIIMRMEIHFNLFVLQRHTVRFLRNTINSQNCSFWNNVDNRLDAVHVQQPTVECELWDWIDNTNTCEAQMNSASVHARTHTHSFFDCVFVKCYCFYLACTNETSIFFCIVTIHHTQHLFCTVHTHNRYLLEKCVHCTIYTPFYKKRSDLLWIVSLFLSAKYNF